jgi:hypothetical protein
MRLKPRAPGRRTPGLPAKRSNGAVSNHYAIVAGPGVRSRSGRITRRSAVEEAGRRCGVIAKMSRQRKELVAPLSSSGVCEGQRAKQVA